MLYWDRQKLLPSAEVLPNAAVQSGGDLDQNVHGGGDAKYFGAENGE